METSEASPLKNEVGIVNNMLHILSWDRRIKLFLADSENQEGGEISK